ncbi:MAG: MotA/TolQ/ExbB proton channel family protein [Calditrichaeota bacterium]|jgi:biopolymer transport protein ExbB|nr:MotA/TolQ/ExbB proton channel family protein [Calditrichota bacterium]MCB9088393.1 MotA/TolQ/ExbB proton channel family protein [Calditrichia bacterium]MCB0288729.1 MotA/TolQ/ExbB proton channel family protein [Calditrichota bacterium]MCB0297393.1 MotA/TolQ/ExbB proton channel family protein [Calditrichota bacterium]MCB0302597.1 MotA/TolQ/ExbB proton channel family protein [Calditrichota bacterium]
MVELYIKGGGFMHPILVMWIVGLAIGIAKLFLLFRAGVNTRKFMVKVRTALKEGRIDEALDTCENTRGPVASIMHAGLSRAKDGVESAEKAITNAASIEMAFLERGMIWLGFIIVVAPLLGFTGTVWGMIEAFNAIEAANDISPAVVAGGISQALLTTLFGLVVAMTVQLFFNMATARIDKLIIDMEESSAELVDALIDMQGN